MTSCGREKLETSTKRRYLKPDLSVREMYVQFLMQKYPGDYKRMRENDTAVEKVDCIIQYHTTWGTSG